MVRYSNSYYKLDITAEGIVSLLDTTDSQLAIMSYFAEYGVTASWRAPLPKAEESIMYVNDASVFEIGDEVRFVNQQVNEIIYHTATIVNILFDGSSGGDSEGVRDLIEFTPALPVGHAIVNVNAQLPHGIVVKKVTNTFSAISNAVISSAGISGGTKIILTCDTTVADIVFNFYCLDNSSKLRVEVISTYKSAVEVFRENLTWIFDDALAGVFTKNRKLVTSSFGTGYWLGNQGCVFGTGVREIVTYNNYKCTSVEVVTADKKLTFNLDDDRDHRFRHVFEYGGEAYEGIFEERNTAIFAISEFKTNEFNFYIGGEFDFHNLPRLMINPNGMLAGFCWDSHADGLSRDSQLAVFYGRSDYDFSEEPVKGLVAHNFVATHGIFYIHTTHSKDIYDDLYSRGYEIALHCFNINWNRTPAEIAASIAAAYPYMFNEFGMKSQSDHDYSVTLDGFCCDALDPTKDAYLGDIWRANGVKYFSSAMSEDINPDGVDALAGAYQDRRSPLYWKHPTRIGNMMVQGQIYKTASIFYGKWATVLGKTNIDTLVNNWGMYAAHLYLAYNFLMENLEEASSTGEIEILDTFNNLIATLAARRDAGELNITTKTSIMQYWERIENLTIEGVGEGAVLIVNKSEEEIKGLSMAVEELNIDTIITQGIGEVLNKREVSASTVFYFDCPVGSSEGTSFLITRYKDIADNQASSTFVGRLQAIFETLSIVANGVTITEITDELVGQTLINAINGNIAAINAVGTPVSVDSVALGMEGKDMIELVNSFYKDYALVN